MKQTFLTTITTIEQHTCITLHRRILWHSFITTGRISYKSEKRLIVRYSGLMIYGNFPTNVSIGYRRIAL